MEEAQIGKALLGASLLPIQLPAVSVIRQAGLFLCRSRGAQIGVC